MAITAISLSSCVSFENSGGPPYDNYRQNPGSVRVANGYGRPYQYSSRYHHHTHYDHGYYGGYKEDRIKLTGGKQQGKPNRPEGYHSREWYENRGYDLDNFKHKHEDSGNTHKGRHYKSSSSSSRSRSSSNQQRSRSRSSSSSNQARSRSRSSSEQRSRSRSSSSDSDSDSKSKSRRR